MNYQQGIGPWAHTISVVAWGGAGNLWCEPRHCPTIATVKHLYSMLSKPSLTPSQPGEVDEGASVCWVFI